MGDTMKIFDLHCDTIYKFVEETSDYSLKNNNGHISEQGLIVGDYTALCLAIYQPTRIKGEDGFDFYNAQYKRFLQTVENSDTLDFAKTKTEILKNQEKQKVSAILTIENSDFLNNDIQRLDVIRNSGARILGIIHNEENCLGYPNSNDKNLDILSLKPFGKEVIDRLNCTDIFADVSHLNCGGFKCVAEISKKPFIATHSCCRDVFEHPRNLYDSQIKTIANSGGIVGVNFWSKTLNGTNKTEIEDIILHLEHLINVGGEDIAAIGTDFDGMSSEISIKGAKDMQIFADSLIKKFGFNLAEKICYKNALKLF